MQNNAYKVINVYEHEQRQTRCLENHTSRWINFNYVTANVRRCNNDAKITRRPHFGSSEMVTNQSMPLYRRVCYVACIGYWRAHIQNRFTKCTRYDITYNGAVRPLKHAAMTQSKAFAENTTKQYNLNCHIHLCIYKTTKHIEYDYRTSDDICMLIPWMLILFIYIHVRVTYIKNSTLRHARTTTQLMHSFLR